MKLNKMILATAAVILPLSVGVGSALAYFTDNASAVGGYAVEIGPDTEMTETFSEWTKHVTVTNTGDVPVYVRVRAFSGSQYPLIYDGGDAWVRRDDGYYYYNNILEKGETTSPILDIRIDGVPENATDKDAFNVIVIYERTPVQYDENGNPSANWEYKLREEKTFPANPGNNNPDNTEDNDAGSGSGSGSENTDTSNTDQSEERGNE